MSSNVIIKTFKIDGMTCVNCQNRIEHKLKSQGGVLSAKVSYSSNTAIVKFDDTLISLEKIVAAIEELDYKVVQTVQQTKEETNITKILAVGIIIFALYMFINMFGGFNIFNAFPQAKQGMSYGMLFIIGMLTSLHCVAMCGGINLSQCVPQKTANLNGGKLATLSPSILYNLGRVISYTIVGAIVGAIGSVVSFSGTAKGIVQLAAGVFMVIMGFNMLNIFPWLRKFNITMPKIFARKINEQKRSNSPLYVGLLNGLMPCGPLQAMQLYALSTGDPLKGALSMFLFSLGTVPLMFGLGALSSLLSKKFTSKMMTASAVLVVTLGVFMFSSGISLSGFAVAPLNVGTVSSAKNSNTATIQDGVQTITTKLTSGRYEPITVQKGVPVKWVIQAKSSDINGCNNKIIIPKFNKEKALVAGDNVIEFTPTESGTFAYSCWMGMIRSKITVVDDINSNSAITSSTDSSSKTVTYKIPTDNIAVAEIKDNIQIVKIDMIENSFTPAVVVMQSGIQTTWIINGVKINNSNSTLIFPLYQAQINMKVGENTINLIPDSDFDFSTADSAFYGYVKVVNDINKIDIDLIKKEVDKYVPAIQEVADNTGLPSCH